MDGLQHFSHIADLPSWNEAEHVAVKMNHIALPAHLWHVLGHAFHQPAAGIRDDQLDAVPAVLDKYQLELSDDRQAITYNYDTKGEHTGITDLLKELRDADIRFNDLRTTQSSLEDIFVDLVHRAQ